MSSGLPLTLATILPPPDMAKVETAEALIRWDADSESWQRVAARVANRDFTWAARRQYFPDESNRAKFPDLPALLPIIAKEETGHP